MAYKLKNSSIEKMFLNDDFADVYFVFNVNGKIQKLPANKINLSILSPVFRAMFVGSLNKKEDVTITDVTIDGFKEFLQFFYLGEVTLTMENIETVVRLANKYNVLDYVNAPFLLSQLTLDKICWGYQLAINLKSEDLIKFCEEKIARSPREVFASDVFEHCDKSILKRILKLDLNCMEIDVFDACLAWAKYACKRDGLDETQAANLKVQLGDCLRLIRFGSMKSDEFGARYIQHKGLFTSDEFEDIMLSLKLKRYEPKIFNRTPRQYKRDAMDVSQDRDKVAFGMLESDKVLQCVRKAKDPHSIAKYIKFPDVTSFSSNHPILLGKIHTACTYNESFRIVGTEVEVTIAEHDDLTLQSNELPKVLYKSTSNTWGGESNRQLIVTLPQPILIKPQHIYEIHLKLPISNGSYYYSYCLTRVNMADGITIQFHRNPTLYHNNLVGWISDLFFNNIKNSNLQE